MRKSGMDKILLCCTRAVIVMNIIGIGVVMGKSCDPFNLNENCGPNESCNVVDDKSKDGTCECIPGFNRTAEDAACLRPQPTEESHVAVAVIVPLVLIVIVILAVHFARRYNFFNWIRYKVKHYNNYDDVMIGQDDD